MANYEDNNCAMKILLWSLIAVVITIIIMCLLVWLYIDWLKQYYINQFTESFEKFCETLPPITYREAVYIPHKNGVYEKKLATARF